MKKRTYPRILACILALLMLLSTMPVMNASAAAWDQPATTISFDASNWSSSVRTLYVLIGHDSWSSVYRLAKQSGNIYKGTIPAWAGATEWYVINADAGWGAEETSPTNRANYAYNKSVKFTSDINSSMLYTPTSSKQLEVGVCLSAGS